MRRQTICRHFMMKAMYTPEQIKHMAGEVFEWAVAARRALHRIPEPGFHEEKTKAFIKQKLTELGLEYEAPEGGWISCYIPGTRPGKVTALRADFDALPIQEPVGCGFESLHPGYMHACGHDMHTAMLLACGKLLKNAPEGFAGGALLMFEPAEETEGGAKPMADSGMLERYKVDRVYGAHVMPRLVVGQIESRPGTLNASTDTISVTVRGASAHGAYPETGKDAILCAAQIVSALQSVVARNVSPLESAVITIGKISGGKASNIICDSVQMEGTLRAADRKLRNMLVSRVREICEYTGRAMGCEAECSISEGYAALVNDAGHAKRVLDVAAKLFGADAALVKDAPSMGAEDFSYFLDHAPGAFFHVGCSPDKEHIGAPLHSERFLPNEQAMLYGISMEAALIMED